MLCFGFTFGMASILVGLWALVYLSGLSREGWARILNGIAIGLMQGRKKPPPEPPAAIPVRLLTAEVIAIPPPKEHAPEHDAEPRHSVPNQPHGRRRRAK